MTIAERVYLCIALIIIFAPFLIYAGGYRMNKPTSLRNMNAVVYTRTVNGYTMYILKSYSSVVAAFYPTANMMYLAPLFDCSQTTKKHVRAFMADYAGVDVPFKELVSAVNVDRSFDGDVQHANIGGHDLWVMLVREHVLREIVLR